MVFRCLSLLLVFVLLCLVGCGGGTPPAPPDPASLKCCHSEGCKCSKETCKCSPEKKCSDKCGCKKKAEASY